MPSKAWEERTRGGKTSSCEEETGTRSSNFVVSFGDCARNSGFPRTSHAAQPEDAALITLIISPCHYSLEDVTRVFGRQMGSCCLSYCEKRLAERKVAIPRWPLQEQYCTSVS